MRRTMLLLILACGLQACARGEPDLITFRNQEGPDEFAILPTKPLQAPPSYSALPPPAPGAANLVDPTPDADAIAALGGQPGVLNRPSPDGGLVRYAGRYGVSPAIRGQLAAEDAAFRDGNRGRFLERLFNVTVYYNVYDDLALDQHRELERFRRAGIRTPAAPPEGLE